MKSKKFLSAFALIMMLLAMLSFSVPAFATEEPAVDSAVVVDSADSADKAEEAEAAENAAPEGAEAEQAEDEDAYADAVDYLDNYADNSLEDENFEEKTAAALETVRAEKPMYATIWSLVPPLVAIVLALITKEVYSSLFIGIVIGGLFSSGFKFTGAVDNIVNDGFIASVSDTAGIFIFLVILGILVALVNRSGGSAAFGKWASKHIKSRVGAQLATFVLGVLIFIDDYFNCLTVGSVMRPVTDRQKISRAKLAYLIDATAAPVCMIAPISSWAAAVASYADKGRA